MNFFDIFEAANSGDALASAQQYRVEKIIMDMVCDYVHNNYDFVVAALELLVDMGQVIKDEMSENKEALKLQLSLLKVNKQLQEIRNDHCGGIKDEIDMVRGLINDAIRTGDKSVLRASRIDFENAIGIARCCDEQLAKAVSDMYGKEVPVVKNIESYYKRLNDAVDKFYKRLEETL